MNTGFSRMIKRAARPLVERIRLVLGTGLPEDEVAAQKVLMQQYRLLAASGNALPSFGDVGFRKYSQFEEDGILLFIFSLIPVVNRSCVEICAGNGRQCNTANLIINHGWWGHLFDGDELHVRSGRAFFAKHPDTSLHPPRLEQAWVTAENVNDLMRESGVTGAIDLLSLDIDGMDYWVWKALKVIDPSVVVCEIHNPIPPDLALTVPYDPKFTFESADYRGASLAAMCKLGREKGYRLIGTHRFGFNAFFMKNGVGDKLFPEVEPAACLNDPFSRHAREKRWPGVKDKAWQAV